MIFDQFLAMYLGDDTVQESICSLQSSTQWNINKKSDTIYCTALLHTGDLVWPSEVIAPIHRVSAMKLITTKCNQTRATLCYMLPASLRLVKDCVRFKPRLHQIHVAGCKF